jgi:4-hydroxy-tetrahydrodipicolinate synthase
MSTDSTAVDISGLIVAVLTPFGADGQIDRDAFVKHLAFLADQGVRTLLINGTTAEFFSLTPEERKELLRLARRSFRGIILYHCGCDSLGLSLELARFGQQEGADAIVAMAPYYLAQAPQRGIIAYFNTLAAAVRIPFLLYNFPRNTGNPLTPAILAAIRHDGLKDSSADLSLIKSTPRYYVGSDEQIVANFDAGGIGFISARANHCPRLYVDIEQAWRAGDREALVRLQQKIVELKKVFSGQTQIAKIKYALSKRLPSYPRQVRLPLVPLTQGEMADVDAWSMADC